MRPHSILEGSQALVSSIIGIENFGRRSCSKLCLRANPDDITLVLREMVELVRRNWNGKPAASKEIWKLRKSRHIADRNQSLEKRTEKKICQLSDWFNQIPAASGLADPARDRHRCIDLVHQWSPDAFEMVELKCGPAETPLRAAIELLEYFALYRFCRAHREELGIADRPILRAAEIALAVRADQPFYQGFDCLAPLEAAIDQGVRQYCRQPPVEFSVGFSFQGLPAEA